MEKAVAIRPQAVLQQATTIVVPATPTELASSMNGLGSGIMLAGWATAATVYAWTEPGKGGPRTERKSAQLSLRQFAELGLRGLTHLETVRSYRDRWQEAIEAGWAKAVTPGDIVTLPEQDFTSTLTDMGGLKSSTGNEWYTPSLYIEAARDVMGGIDLDPASSALANQTVKADTWWGVDDKDEHGNDSLGRDWFGRVWLNPPYGKGSGLFTLQLTSEYDAGRVEQAVLLLNAYGFDSDWFDPLWRHPICFTDHRIEFTSPTRTSGGPANGNVFVYLGPSEQRFAEVFSGFGHVVRTWP